MDVVRVLYDGQWGILQNGCVFHSAQLLNTDYRMFVATMKLRLKFSGLAPSKKSQWQPRLLPGSPVRFRSCHSGHRKKCDTLSEASDVHGINPLSGALSPVIHLI